MTLGFSLGFILSKEQIGTYWFGSVSAISVISWTIFFFVIQIRAFFGLSGLKISYFSIIGFISIVLGYVAMYYLELPSHTFLYNYIVLAFSGLSAAKLIFKAYYDHHSY